MTGLDRPDSHPLAGTAKVGAFAARMGLVFIKIDAMPGVPDSASLTVYRLAEFRTLIAELTAVADDCEAQQHLPLHEVPDSGASPASPDRPGRV